MDRKKRLYIWALAVVFMAIGVWQSRQAAKNSEKPATVMDKNTGPVGVPPSPEVSKATELPGDAPPGTENTEPKPIKTIGANEFHTLTQKTLAGLPTLESLHALDAAQVHDTPSIMMAAGESLGHIAQIVHDNPSLKNDGLAFYESCYLKENLPPQIRALCVTHHRNLRMTEGDKEEWLGSEAKLPANILSLANETPSDTE